jgi:hypothetical protein
MLQECHRVYVDGRLVFDRQADGRAKTGRAAIGTLSWRTERLVAEYLAGTRTVTRCGVVPECARARPYREATLAHDFGDIGELVFPGDTRRLMDMRRSGVV